MADARKVRFTIDGKEAEVDEGTTVLEAARKLNVSIPTLCHHDALSSYGACRLCCVEVTQGTRTDIKASCQLKAQDGMAVKTDTDRVRRGRRLMAELLLARCPDSEAVQKITTELGVTEVRVSRKDDDCILCGLCVRMCHERMGIGAISFAERGSRRRLTPPFDANSDVCQTCGACEFVCPTDAIRLKKLSKNAPRPIKDEFNQGLGTRLAALIQYPQPVPNWPIIDKERCVHFVRGTCGICSDLCEAGAIDHDQKPREVELDVGSVIVSPGFETYEPPKGDSYGYGIYPNVLTSIEFERMLSASGPFKGHIQRLSDGEAPKRIAWLQCVGSRDESCDRPYCSSVCCMYATKEAVIAKEHQPGLETHIYYMDMRSFGKDFDKYFERARDEYGVAYRRCRIPHLEQDQATKGLTVRYVDEESGKVSKEAYDMVVLSVGLQPCKALGDLSTALKVNLNRYGFVETEAYAPVSTSRPGVFASGAATEPKDIPESVTQASAAAASAACVISEARGTEVRERAYPAERSVADEDPRIGVFVCHCGINIAGVVDVKKVVEHARTLPGVVFADHNLFTCSQDTQERMKEKIKEHRLNRVVVASCTPRTHEPLFQETLRDAGLNPHLFEMTNIRDHNSWVHRKEPGKATKKAMDAVAMAVAKAANLYPVAHRQTDVVQTALVIGGGIAGMTAALDIADQGFKVLLVEREGELGGHLRHVRLGFDGEDPQELLRTTEGRVRGHPDIELHTDTGIEDISGYVGNFTTRLHAKGQERETEIRHGVVVVATGAEAYKPTEHLHGKNEAVRTQEDFERDLAEGKPYVSGLKEVVMIQCVGSRNGEHPYCSRMCCSQALKNAVRLKELNPNASVFVLYRDIRTYGFKEDILYRKARMSGVVFVRYDADDEPKVEEKDGRLTVRVKDKVVGRGLRLNPDAVVLSSGVVPRDNGDLAQMLKVPLNADGFFVEAHMKLRPVEFATEGVYLCGMAHSPRFIEESVVQAKAAASRAATVLSRRFLETKGNIAHVTSRNCAGCQLCIAVCPYEAIDFDKEKRVVKVNEILCQGCGSCSAVCPSGTSQQNTFTKRQILAMIESCLR